MNEFQYVNSKNRNSKGFVMNLVILYLFEAWKRNCSKFGGITLVKNRPSILNIGLEVLR